ncbi:MAG: hypothetical protein IT204_25660 [Fimbriimonadaceae bacterium]|nr:hypothetical protein [Fimbriimonadaceae bacterium]
MRFWRCGLLGVVGCLGLLLAQAPTITLRVVDEPLVAVLGEVARQAGLELQWEVEQPAGRVSLELRAVTLAGALEPLCGRLGCSWAVAGGKLLLQPPPAPPSAPLPTVEGVPATVQRLAADRLASLRRSPDAAGVTAFGNWLRTVRPDWREALTARLPELWLHAADEPAVALRGARAMVLLGEWEAARRLIGVARREPQQEVAARLLAAEVELQRGSAVRARQELLAAQQLAPDQPAAAAAAATALLYLGREEEALAEALAAQARWPRDAAVLGTLGNILRRTPALAGEADVVIQTALNLDPEQPDALFGRAVLDARESPQETGRWEHLRRVEPFTVRSERARLGLVATGSVRLTERGGPAWDVSDDGTRVLYYMRFRKQLEITDSSGFGLALQVTDHDTEKVGCSLGPTEQELAWIVSAPDGDRLYLQNINASGHQQELLQAPRGSSLRRTAWSPDGKLLLYTVSTVAAGATSVSTAAWEVAAGRPATLPTRLQLPGLGDLQWRRDGWAVGTLTRDGGQAVVASDPQGVLWLLRPWQRGRGYRHPVADRLLSRVLYVGTEPLAACTDGALGGEVPLLTAASTSPALWAGDESVVATLDDAYPTLLRLAGLPRTGEVLAKAAPLLDGLSPTAPQLAFRLRLLQPGRVTAQVTATIVADDGRSAWTGSQRLSLEAAPALALFTPTSPPPRAWLRLDVAWGGQVDLPRWYRLGPVGE